MRRIDGIKSRHHRGVERVDPPDARIGIGRKLRQSAAERVADGGDLSRSAPVARVAHDMVEEVADMVAHLVVLVVDGESAQNPVEVGFPVSFVPADGAAKGDDSFGTASAHARPDLDWLDGLVAEDELLHPLPAGSFRVREDRRAKPLPRALAF